MRRPGLCPVLRTLTAGAIVLAGIALLAVGCGKNSATTVLVPTGIRPAPQVPTGGLTGLVQFDAAVYAGLDQAPFPPSTVQLFLGSTKVAETETLAGNRAFLFERLRPGDYNIAVRSHAFSPRNFGPFRVVDRTRDAGDMRLLANPSDSLASSVYVMGTMPGFDADGINTLETLCNAPTVGVWSYPFFPVKTIAAGTYRLKFITDESSTPQFMIGWGGDGVTTLTAPVLGASARFGNGATSDLVVNFPVTGDYAMNFDERRLTIDISRIPPRPEGLAAPAGGAAHPPTPRRLP